MIVPVATEWRSTPPNLAGWYWWYIDAVSPCIAHVYQLDGGEWMAACPEWEGLYEPHVYPLESVSINARWFGPLELPAWSAVFRRQP